MPNVLELFSQPEILNYLGNRQYPALLGETLFPEVKRESWNLTRLKVQDASLLLRPFIHSIPRLRLEAENLPSRRWSLP